MIKRNFWAATLSQKERRSTRQNAEIKLKNFITSVTVKSGSIGQIQLGECLHQKNAGRVMIKSVFNANLYEGDEKKNYRREFPLMNPAAEKLLQLATCLLRKQDFFKLKNRCQIISSN